MTSISSLRFRVTLLGATGAGKTSFVRKACNLPFDENLNESDNTLQINHIQLKDPTGLSAPFRIDFYDIGATAAEEELTLNSSSSSSVSSSSLSSSSSSSSYRYRWETLLDDTDAIILCYDITDMTSFLTATAIYMQRIHTFYNTHHSSSMSRSSHRTSTLPILLFLGCKSDLVTDPVPTTVTNDKNTVNNDSVSSLPYRQVPIQQGETTAAAHGAFFMEISSKMNTNIDLTLTILRLRLQQYANRQGLFVLTDNLNNNSTTIAKDNDNTNPSIEVSSLTQSVIPSNVSRTEEGTDEATGASSSLPSPSTAVLPLPSSSTPVDTIALVDAIQAIPDIPTVQHSTVTDNDDSAKMNEHNDEEDKDDDDDDDDDDSEIFGAIKNIIQRNKAKLQGTTNISSLSNPLQQDSPITVQFKDNLNEDNTRRQSNGVLATMDNALVPDNDQDNSNTTTTKNPPLVVVNDPVFPLFAHSTTPPRLPSPSSSFSSSSLNDSSLGSAFNGKNDGNTNKNEKDDDDGVPNIATVPLLVPSLTSYATVVPSTTTINSSNSYPPKPSSSSSLIPPPLNASFASTMSNPNYIQRNQNNKNSSSSRNTSGNNSMVGTKDDDYDNRNHQNSFIGLNNSHHHPSSLTSSNYPLSSSSVAFDSPLASSTLTVPSLNSFATNSDTTNTGPSTATAKSYVGGPIIDRPTKPIRSRANSITSNVSLSGSTSNNIPTTMMSSVPPGPMNNHSAQSIPPPQQQQPQPRIKSITLSDLQSPVPLSKQTVSSLTMDDTTTNSTGNSGTPTPQHPLPFPITSWEELVQTLTSLPITNIADLPSLVLGNGISPSLSTTTNVPLVSVPIVKKEENKNDEKPTNDELPHQSQDSSSLLSVPFSMYPYSEDIPTTSEPLTSSALDYPRVTSTVVVPSDGKINESNDNYSFQAVTTDTLPQNTPSSSSVPAPKTTVPSKPLPAPLTVPSSSASSSSTSSSTVPSLPSLVIHNQLTALPRSLYELDDPKRILSTLHINLANQTHLGSIQIRRNTNPHHTAYRFITSKPHIDIAYVVSLTQAIQRTLDNMLHKIEEDRQRIIGTFMNSNGSNGTKHYPHNKDRSVDRSVNRSSRSQSATRNRTTNHHGNGKTEPDTVVDAKDSKENKRLSPRREFLRQKRLEKQHQLEETVDHHPNHHHHVASNVPYYTESEEPFLPLVPVRNYTITTDRTNTDNGSRDNSNRNNNSLLAVPMTDGSGTEGVNDTKTSTQGTIPSSDIHTKDGTHTNNPSETLVPVTVPSSSTTYSTSSSTLSGGSLLRELLAHPSTESIIPNTVAHPSTESIIPNTVPNETIPLSSSSTTGRRQLRFATTPETIDTNANTTVPSRTSLGKSGNHNEKKISTNPVVASTKVIRGRGTSSFMAPTQASSSRVQPTVSSNASSLTRTARQRSLSRTRNSSTLTDTPNGKESSGTSHTNTSTVTTNNLPSSSSHLPSAVPKTISENIPETTTVENTPKPAISTIPSLSHSSNQNTDTLPVVSQLPSTISTLPTPSSSSSFVLSSSPKSSSSPLSFLAQRSLQSAKAKYDKLHQSRVHQDLQKSIALRGNRALKPSSPSSTTANRNTRNGKRSLSRSSRSSTGDDKQLPNNGAFSSSVSSVPARSTVPSSVIGVPSSVIPKVPLPSSSSSSSRRTSSVHAASTQALWEQVLGDDTMSSNNPTTVTTTHHNHQASQSTIVSRRNSQSSMRHNSSTPSTTTAYPVELPVFSTVPEISRTPTVPSATTNTNGNDKDNTNDSFGPEYDIDIGIGFIANTTNKNRQNNEPLPVPPVPTTTSLMIPSTLPVSDDAVDNLNTNTTILHPSTDPLVSSFLPPPPLPPSSILPTLPPSSPLPPVPNQVVPIKGTVSPRKPAAELFQALKAYVKENNNANSNDSVSVTQLSPNLKTFLQQHPILPSPVKVPVDDEDEDKEDDIDIDDEDENSDPHSLPYQRLTPSQRKLINVTLQGGSSFRSSIPTNYIPSSGPSLVQDSAYIHRTPLGVVPTKEAFEKSMGIVLPPPLPPPPPTHGRSSRKSSRRSSLAVPPSSSMTDKDTTNSKDTLLNTSGVYPLEFPPSRIPVSTLNDNDRTVPSVPSYTLPTVESSTTSPSSLATRTTPVVKPLFNLDIDIGQGIKGRIIIYPNPRIPLIAETFIQEYSLPVTLLPKLIHLIEKAVKNQALKQQS